MGLFDRFGKNKDSSEEASAESESDSGGLFSRFRRGLRRTSDLLNTDIRDIFKQEGQLVDDATHRHPFVLQLQPAAELSAVDLLY